MIEDESDPLEFDVDFEINNGWLHINIVIFSLMVDSAPELKSRFIKTRRAKLQW